MAEDKIVDKIKALFNKAESCRNLGSLHEAEAFMAKVQELLLQYNIDMAKLMERTESVDDNGVTHITFETGDTQGGDRWMFDLLKVLAQANGCKAYIVSKPRSPKPPKGYKWVLTDAQKLAKRQRQTGVYGRKQALEMLELMFDYLVANLTAMSRSSYSAENKAVLARDKVTRFSYLQSYLLGATEALMIRVQKSQKQDVIGTNALIMYNAAAVEKYGAETLGIHTVKVKGIAKKATAFDKGFKAATAMSLQAQMHIK